MRNLPVYWKEGMFLRPHHFQAAERYWSEAIQSSESWDHAYNYGLRSINISAQAISNYQFQVTECHARMKDGTLVSLEAGQEPDRVDIKQDVRELSLHVTAKLKDALSSETVIRVFLAIPKLELGRPNVEADGGEDHRRYSATTLGQQDENEGGNEKPIQHRSLSVRLLLSTEDVSGYETLPIAQIKRVGEGEVAPQLDDDYFPPVLAVDAWPALGPGLVRDVYDMIGDRINRLSEKVIELGLNLAATEPEDLEKVLRLRMLNEAYASLGCLAFASGVHPLVAYTELCRVVGMLAILGKDRRVPEIPRYDHDDLARIFKWVRKHIDDLSFEDIRPGYYQVYFEGAGIGMQVELKREWFQNDWRWYVGVNPHNLTQDECADLLSPRRLNWKMGSVGNVDAIFEEGRPGVRIAREQQAPRELPSRGNWLYYKVDPNDYEWEAVVGSKTLAMRFAREHITNLANLPGQRDLRVATPSGRDAILQFAVFAVTSQG